MLRIRVRLDVVHLFVGMLRVTNWTARDCLLHGSRTNFLRLKLQVYSPYSRNPYGRIQRRCQSRIRSRQRLRIRSRQALCILTMQNKKFHSARALSAQFYVSSYNFDANLKVQKNVRIGVDGGASSGCDTSCRAVRVGKLVTVPGRATTGTAKLILLKTQNGTECFLRSKLRILLGLQSLSTPFLFQVDSSGRICLFECYNHA